MIEVFSLIRDFSIAKGHLMGEIDDFVNDDFTSRGMECGEGVRYPDDSRSLILHRHKLTKQAYDGMYIAQKGCCVICGRHQSEFKQRLHVDHCHKSGKIRGLLCFNCNCGLGNFKDNPPDPR